ncbi:MAG: hypothetical protein JSV49_00610, partial [Thermoplasmata archaeon]
RQDALKALKLQKVPITSTVFTPSFDLRYKGQSYEVNAPMHDSIKNAVELFHDTHKSRFGYSMPDVDVELVNIRLSVHSKRKDQELLLKRARRARKGKRTSSSTRKHKHPEPVKQLTTVLEGKKHKTPLFDRTALAAGMTLEGPAIIADTGSTTLVQPDMTMEIDKFGNIIISI